MRIWEIIEKKSSKHSVWVKYMHLNNDIISLKTKRNKNMMMTINQKEKILTNIICLLYISLFSYFFKKWIFEFNVFGCLFSIFFFLLPFSIIWQTKYSNFFEIYKKFVFSFFFFFFFSKQTNKHCHPGWGAGVKS